MEQNECSFQQLIGSFCEEEEINDSERDADNPSLQIQRLSNKLSQRKLVSVVTKQPIKQV